MDRVHEEVHSWTILDPQGRQWTGDPCFVYVPARKGLSRLGKNASASREVRERKNQPRPQGLSLKKWVGREKVLFQLRRKTLLAPLEFNLCFLAKYQVNTANHLFSVFLFHYGVFSNITPFWEEGTTEFFFCCCCYKWLRKTLFCGIKESGKRTQPLK